MPPFSPAASGAPRAPTWHQVENVGVSAKHAAMLLLRLEVGRPDLFPEDQASAIAFTLAATLQDVLGSLFPPFVRRIAVVSPQAAGCVAAILDEPAGDTDQVNRFPVDLYPRLVETFDRSSAREGRPLNSEAGITEFLSQHYGAPGTAAKYVDLLVIEDADHDLGIVRALVEGEAIFDRVVRLWDEFARWLAEHGEDEDLYYRFGSGGLSSCFRFREAGALIDSITRQ